MKRSAHFESARHRRPIVPRRGMVLIIVAVVMALVSLAAMGFLVTMRIDYRVARLQADQQQTELLAASAETYVRAWAAAPRALRARYLSSDSPADWFRGVRVDVDPLTGRQGRFSLLVPRYALDSPDPVFEFGLQPTTAKLSLTTLLAWDAAIPGQGRRSLLQLPGMTQEIADSLLDWIDADDVPREFGAEAEFYLGLDPPRQPANRVPATLEELLAIRGVTAWQMFGKEEGPFALRNLDDPRAAMAATTEPTSATTALGSAGQWDVPAPPWCYFLTTISAERNVNAQGRPRINLNQDDLTALHTALQPLGAEIANFVIAYRQQGPSQVLTEQADAATLPPPNALLSGAHTLESAWELIDAVVTLPNAAPGDDHERSGSSARHYRSPFSSRETASLSRFIRFCDAVTFDRSPVLEGRINVMLAPRPVLLAIPGLEEETADRILAARDQPVRQETNRDDPAWLLAEGILEADVMKTLAPQLTIGGDVFQTQIIAFYDAQSPWVREEVTIDGTRANQPTVYFRDLRRLGRGFPWEALVSPAPLDRESQSPTEPISPFGNSTPRDVTR